MYRQLLLSFSLLALVACGDDASSPDGAGPSSGSGGTGSGNPGAGGDAPGSGGTSSSGGAAGVGAGGDGGGGGDTPYEKLPCSLTIGSGSGTIDIDSGVGSDGDVICVAAGSYSGGSIANLSKRTIQNDGGVVTITGTVHIGGLSEVTLSGSGDEASPYGFLFTGDGAGMVIDDANQKLVIHDVESIEAGILLDAGHTGTVWSGDPSGFVLYDSKIDRIHLARSGQLFQGNYGPPGGLENLVSKVEMANVVVEDSRGTGQNVVAGGGMFDMNVHDWTITAKNDVVVGSDDDRDTGVFYIAGSGTFRRMHRDGGWGWLVRTFGAQIGPDPGEFHCEDNVDLNTEYYGTCEIRNTDGPTYLIDGVVSTVDIWIERNVSGHKQDIKGGYTTAIGLVGNLAEGTTATLKDNVGCDNAQDYGDMESLHFFVVEGTVVKENNQQLESCDGVVDPITMQPL